MFGFIKRLKALEERNRILEGKTAALEAKVEELSKKTISQKTLQEDEPPSPSQILNEWLNGEEQDNGN